MSEDIYIYVYVSLILAHDVYELSLWLAALVDCSGDPLMYLMYIY